MNVGQGERMASALGGGLLVRWGLRRFSVGGLLAAAAGSALLYRGVTGHCPAFERLDIDTAARGKEALEVNESVTVYKPRDDVYGFWREVENLPHFMRHLQSVEDVGENRSRWTARVPGGLGHVTWEAEVTEDEPGERISWRSLPEADISNAGTVRFEDAPRGDGTVVHVEISYRPPAGDVGALAAKLLNPANRQLVKDDVRRFKSLMETGEVPTIEGQPKGN